MDLYCLLTYHVIVSSLVPSIGGQAVTSCAGSPCKNGAICEDTETGYQCFCVDGFAGENCDINFDDCSSGPCKNNATCTDGVADYTCTCPRGFTGKDCLINIDECQPNPCLMNGTCIDLIDSFVCECLPPFRGDNCSLLPCDTGPCENRAECENDISFNRSLTGYVCNCIQGFSGQRCELNLEDCDLENGTSCNGNGLCIDGINDYSCLCEPGWIGDFCQLPVNDCIGNDCRNNGTCVDQHLGYVCACPDGYEGDLCERERDECTTWFPCQNEAVCVDLFNDYRCECKSGWVGVNCSEEVNECLANQCLNGAQCLDIVDGFICRCPPFFTGALCETPFNPCSPEYNPCKNGANCIAPPDGGYVCFCTEGFTGANCEVNVNECLLYPCDNNATCEDIVDGYMCHCRAGWTGLHCTDNIDDCLPQPCSNGATCLDLLNGFLCDCTADYKGRLCEEPVDFCLQSPCFNDGTCLSLTGDFQCQCLAPYTGRNCLDLINACESSPCLQNSTCINTPNGYECVCESPYTGKNCDIITNYCESQPCLNGGSCRQLRDGWICICPMYLTGRQCTDLIDHCSDNPCLNGGLCINNEFGSRCVCLFGYTGNLCQDHFNFCADDPCLNSGSCLNIPGGFICECSHNYTGELCESEVDIMPETSTKLELFTSTSDYPSLPISYSSGTDKLFSVSTPAMFGTCSSVIQTLASEFSSLAKSVQSVSSTVFVKNTTYRSDTDSTLTKFFSQVSHSLFSIPMMLNVPTIQGSSTSLSILTGSITHEISFTDNHSTVLTDKLVSSDSSALLLSSSPISSTEYSFIHSITTLIFPADLSSDLDNLHSSMGIPVSITITTYMDESSSVMSIEETIGTETVFQSDWSFLGSTFVSHMTDRPEPQISGSFSLTLPIKNNGILHTSTDSLVISFYNSSITKLNKYINSPTLSFLESQYLSIPHSDPPSSLFKSNSSSVHEETDIYLSESSFSAMLSIPFALLSSLSQEPSSSLRESSFSSQVSGSIHPQISAENTNNHISSNTDRIQTSTGGSPILSAVESSFMQSETLYSTSYEQPTLTSNSSQTDHTSQGYILPSWTDVSLYSASTFSSENIKFTHVSKSFETLYSTSLTDTSSFIFNRITPSIQTSFNSALYTMPSFDSLKATTYVEESKFTNGAINMTSLLPSNKIGLLPTFSIIFSQSEDFNPSRSRAISSDLFLSYTSVSISTSGSKAESKSLLNNYSISNIVTRSQNMEFETSTPIHISVYSFTLKSSQLSDFGSSIINLSSFDSESRSSFESVQANTFQQNTSMTDVSVFVAVESSTHLSVELQSSQESKSTESVMFTSRASEPSITQTHFFESNVSQGKTGEGQSFSSVDSLTSSLGFSSHWNSLQPSMYATVTLDVFTSHSLVEQPKLSASIDFDDISDIFPSTSYESLYETSFRTSDLYTFSPMSILSIDEISKSDDSQQRHSPTVFESMSTSYRYEVSSIGEPMSANMNSFMITSHDVASTIVTVNIEPSPVVSAKLPSTTLIPATSTLPPELCETFNCENNGTCREDIVGPYCDCPIGFIGSFCTVEATACDGIQCDNGGVCTVVITTQNQQVPLCKCPVPYTGTFCNQELLLYYPYFHGQSFLTFGFNGFFSTMANELFLNIKSTQSDGTVLISTADQNIGARSIFELSFVHLYIKDGMLGYRFSCDGLIFSSIDTGEFVNTGNLYDIIIRQTWPSSAGEWCSASLVLNSRTYISAPVLTGKTPQTLRDLVIGGILRHKYENDKVVTTDVIDGYVGCVQNLQINGDEIDMINTAKRAMNIGNCNVPVCQHNPCKNGASCHSVGEDWYCACLVGYGGDLCEIKLCGNNPCYHGGSCVVLESEKSTLCICPYGRAGALCEKELRPTIPHFSGTMYGHTSYVAYSNVHFMTYNFEIEFLLVIDNNESQSNLIMYMGNNNGEDGISDYFVVALFRGYLLVRFDLGSGEYHIHTETVQSYFRPVKLCYSGNKISCAHSQGDLFSPDQVNLSMPQHHVKLGRNGRLGWLKLDDQNNVTGQSMGVLTALNVNPHLYVGGHELEDSLWLPPLARFDDGLKGCVYDLKIRTLKSNFVEPGSPPGHVEKGRNIGECSSISCDPNPCQNRAECVDLGASIFCNCTEEWTGIFCTDQTTVCDYNHTCSGGSTCLPTPSGGYRCVCPLGKKGDNCDEDLIITDPLFVGEESFMSFTPVYIKKNIDIVLQIKTDQPTGLLFYVALRLHSNSGDFLSLTLLNWSVELRFSLGSALNVLRSVNMLQSNQDIWHTIQAGRNSTHGYISVDGNMTVSMITGTMSYLDTTTDFYLGGLPALEDASPLAFEDEPVAFEGCIREFKVNNKAYELTSKGATDGRNIDDCDGTECGYNVCHNDGKCHVTDDGSFNCSCPESHYGDTCTMAIQCRNHECVQGDCIPGDPYRCYCYLGWTGERCNIDKMLGSSVRFEMTSYLVCNVTDSDPENKTSTHVTLTFTSTSLNGLLFWNGQTYTDDEDYLGVGLFDGRLKVVWNLGWYSRTETITSRRYNDGQWHTFVINRQGQLMTFIVDSETYESRVTGDFNQLDTGSLYHLGNFMNGIVKQQTLGNFMEPFAGCVKDFSVNGRVVSFHEASDGNNVEPCEPN